LRIVESKPIESEVCVDRSRLFSVSVHIYTL
jgi:hypothetical protein